MLVQADNDTQEHVGKTQHGLPDKLGHVFNFEQSRIASRYSLPLSWIAKVRGQEENPSLSHLLIRIFKSTSFSIENFKFLYKFFCTVATVNSLI